MSRARELAKLGNTDAIGIDGVDIRTGSIAKGTQLDVASHINVTGVITATNFIGNASGLTGLGAVGAGLTVFRSNNSLGAITKLNFDNTFGITDPAAGLSTVTSGVTTANPRSSSLVVAGVSTLSGQVSAGNLSVVGVVTSTSFTKSGGTSSQYLMADGSVSTSSGVGNTADVSTSGLVVAGISTLQNITAGVVTSTSFIKSGGTSSQYLMADGSVSASGAGAGSTADVSTSGLVVAGISTLAGATFSGFSTFSAIRLGDGTDGNTNNIKFGADNDLEIYHNGSHAFLQNITGNVYLRSNAGSSINIEPAAGYSGIIANAGADVELYYNNSKKLETDVAGVIITGIATATGLSVTGQSTLSNLNVSSGIATVAGQTNLANLNVTGVTTVGVMTASSLEVTTGIATFAGESSTTQGIHLDIGSQKLKIFGGSNETYFRNTDGSGGGGGINIQGRNGASLWQGTGNVAVSASSDGAGILYYQSSLRVGSTSTGVNLAGIVSATTHVNSGIVTYYGDSSYSAAGRWVLGADGSNHYTFTGPGLGHSTQNDPALYLKRGQTYMFENKMGAHPFRIQSTANGSTGTQWNVGVTNQDVSNGVLIFEVPFVTPNTLYYQCTAHANMGGVINIA
jgi:hypothetical protein